MKTNHYRTLALTIPLAFAAMLGGLTTAATAGDSVSLVSKDVPYDDVRQDLESAIATEGLKIDYNGNINNMLKRTGADVGSNQPIYEHAEFFTFCSSKLSRAMMEADPANMSQCPYVMFLYQRATNKKEVVVGYRKVAVEGHGKKALEEINKLLDRIAHKVVK